MLSFDGSSLFRHHLVSCILSKKSIRLTNIHAEEDPPGIQPHEANFLKFIDRVTSGSSFQVSNHNTELLFNPGLILGGVFSHDVPSNRCVTYIAEAAVLLLPFAKLNSKITLLGSTHSEDDLCVDTFRTVTTRWLQLFGVECSVRLIRRGCPPVGGGAMDLSINAVRKLKSANLVDRGRVRRVRGIAYACRTAPDLPQRTATSAKGVLLQLLPDVYVVTDVDKGRGASAGSGGGSGSGSGYGVVLVAETTSKLCVISQEASARPAEAPEDVGARAAKLLLDQIFEGGSVDGHHQMLVLLLMALSPDEVSVVRLGTLNSSGVSALVLMEQYFGVSCAIKDEVSELAGRTVPASTLVTCIGSNTVNVSKRSS